MFPHSRPSWLLCSDLDGTLLGDDHALARFHDWWQAASRSVALVYVTGRFFASVQGLVEEGILPSPRCVIGGVGSEIHEFPSGHRIDDWPIIPQGAWDPEWIRGSLSRIRGITPQPAEYQTDRKCSFFAPRLSCDALELVRDILRQGGQAADLIYSLDLYLDVMPAGVNKGSAVRWLAERWEVDSESVLVAGDTGNDLAMMQAGFRGIVVGNAAAELRSYRSGRVYHARESHAAGVLEGIHYWTRNGGTAYS